MSVPRLLAGSIHAPRQGPILLHKAAFVTEPGAELSLKYPDVATSYNDDLQIFTYRINSNEVYDSSLVAVLLNQNLELREKIILMEQQLGELESKVTALYHAPPGDGGPGYYESERSFNDCKRKRVDDI